MVSNLGTLPTGQSGFCEQIQKDQDVSHEIPVVSTFVTASPVRLLRSNQAELFPLGRFNTPSEQIWASVAEVKTKRYSQRRGVAVPCLGDDIWPVCH